MSYGLSVRECVWVWFTAGARGTQGHARPLANMIHTETTSTHPHPHTNS